MERVSHPHSAARTGAGAVFLNLRTAVDCQGGRRVYGRSRFPSAACFTQWVSRLETARRKKNRRQDRRRYEDRLPFLS